MTASRKFRVRGCCSIADESSAVIIVASVLEYFFNTVSAYLHPKSEA